MATPRGLSHPPPQRYTGSPHIFRRDRGGAILISSKGEGADAEKDGRRRRNQGGGGRKYSVEAKTEAARARIKTGLTQAEFAALLGVSKRTLEQWERGRREPSGAAKTLLRIAQMSQEVMKAAM